LGAALIKGKTLAAKRASMRQDRHALPWSVGNTLAIADYAGGRSRIPEEFCSELTSIVF
jgi:hypothetical protein